MLSLAKNMFVFQMGEKKNKGKPNCKTFACRSYGSKKERYPVVAMEIQNNLNDIFRISLNSNLICLDIS